MFDCDSFIRIVNDVDDTASTQLQKLRGKNGIFHLCLAGTATSDIDGISAAGITAESRRLTPAIDAEALLCGTTLTAPTIPVSPSGIASPIVITRACINLTEIEAQVFDCGAFAPPQVTNTKCGASPAACITTGQALPLSAVRNLWEWGVTSGEIASREFDFVALGECVPGGTTTALGILTALSHRVDGMLSSSLPQAEHDRRYELVAEGLNNADLETAAVIDEPLLAVAAVGDPMQPFVAGFAYGAAAKIPVLLAGGSQMLAVFALFRAMARKNERDAALEKLPLPIVATTKWVAFDPSARTQELSRLVGAPYVAACPNFLESRHAGMRAYEAGHVKEGTGAGAAMLLAHLVGGFGEQTIVDAIDDTYDELFGKIDAVI